jgi:hypothetical protein
MGLAAAEARQPPGGLALNEGLQTFVDELRSFLDSGEPLCLLEQPVVEIDRRSHAFNDTSLDAYLIISRV